MSAESSLERVLRGIKALPTLPHVYQSVLQLAEEEDTSAAKMARVIQGDQALTTKLLGLVNSPYYGLAGKVTTVARAIAVLGFKNLCNVVVSVSVVDLFKGGNDPRFNLVEFWKHSLAVATCSRVVARVAQFSDPEPFFVAGLLHDVGKLVESQYLSEEFPRVLDMVSHGTRMNEAEQRVLGFSHDQMGRDLLKRWRLPDLLVCAVGGHHHPSADPDHIREAAVVHVADILCIAEGLGSGGNSCVPTLDRVSWDTIGLHPGEIDSVLERTWIEFQQASAWLTPGAGPKRTAPRA